MTRDEIIAKYKQYLFPSVTTYFTDPLVTDHASMQYLWDIEGKKYLDFFGGIVTISVGHSQPARHQQDQGADRQASARLDGASQ